MIVNTPKKMVADDFDGDWKKDMPDVFRIFNDLATQATNSITQRITPTQNMGWQAIQLDSVIVPDCWQAPDGFLDTGVTNLGTVNEPAGYMKDSFGKVEIRGLVVKASTGLMITVTAPFAPKFEFDVATIVNHGGADLFATLRVKADGTVNILTSAPSAYGSIRCTYQCADSSPYIPSCFPIKVNSKLPGGKASAVLMGLARDITQNGAMVALPPNSVAWHNETGFSGNSGANSIVIDNIQGLLPLHTYQITLFALPQG